MITLFASKHHLCAPLYVYVFACVCDVQRATTPLDQQVKHALLQNRRACVPIIKHIRTRRTAQCRRILSLVVELQLLTKFISTCTRIRITRTKWAKIELQYKYRSEFKIQNLLPNRAIAANRRLSLM